LILYVLATKSGDLEKHKNNIGYSIHLQKLNFKPLL